MGWTTYFRDDVWKGDLRRARWHRRIGLGALRAVALMLQNFERHLLSTRAAALTMTTLLAIVPLAATGFSVAKGFGFGEELDASLVALAADLPPHFRDGIETVRQLVASIDFRQLGLLSSLIVVYTGMSLFVRTEGALNDIWRASARRSWIRRISDFLALVFLVPGLALGSVALSSVLKSGQLVESWRASGWWAGWIYDAWLGFLPYVMLGAALTALYAFMPNTRVRLLAAAVGGFLAGTVLLWMHGLYLYFQIGVGQNNAIYATLAALPLLIVYSQLAWTIVLLGAELSHAVQNADLLGGGKPVDEISPALCERLSLAVVDRVVANFVSGEGGLSIAKVATEVDVPRTLLDKVLEPLLERGILARSEGDRLLPARPVERISIDAVRHAARGAISDELHAKLTLSEPIEIALRQAEQQQRSALERVRFSA